jgi:hypothetical protein
MEAIQLQQSLFKHIKANLPSHLSLVDEVAELLNISNDSAYRRIRGEKPISFEEIQKLCKTYQLSLDQMMNIETKNTIFMGNWIDANGFDFEQYLKGMLLQVQSINSAGQKNILYEAKDFPPFHYFNFPDLAAFKYFFWMKTILSSPECANMSFEDHEFGKTLYKTGLEIIRVYNQIPSTEIWSIETINTTIRQIEYYRETGCFRKKENIDLLYDQLGQMLDHVKKEATLGEKLLLKQKPLGNKNFELYCNEVYLGHNTIITEMDGVDTVFINHGILNYMSTRDSRYCAYTRKYFHNTISKSSLISSVSEKERNRFFNILHQKIKIAQSQASVGELPSFTI